jgi:hypothetical protein
MNSLLYGFEDVPYEDGIGAGWEEDSWDEETENPDEEFEDWE